MNKYKNIIDWAKKQLDEDVVVSKEVHGDRSDVYRLAVGNKSFFLKIGTDFSDEKERLGWLGGRLPVPETIDFIQIDDHDVLLLSGIKGKNLKILSKEWPAEKVVNKLAEALRAFHSTDITDCPFGVVKIGDVLIHGDASLPNFIFEGGEFSGYIDLGDVSIGNKEIDFAAAIWSLQYNLGSGYGKMFLERYGVRDVTEETVERLRLMYENMQDGWGLR